jgi:hypothetical protein
MHRDVDAAIQQRLLDLAGEQALAADFLQRLVEDLVAGDLDHRDREGGLGQVEGGHQAGARLVRLGQRQGRSTGADFQGCGGRGECVSHGQALALSGWPDNSEHGRETGQGLGGAR